MPEYLAPGVYIEEVSSPGQSIEGVSTSTAEFLGTELISRLRQIVMPDHHDWGDQGRCDVSVPVLELCAWLTEHVVARVNHIPDDGVPHAARLAAAALSLIVERKLPIGSTFKRTRFMPGYRIGKNGELIASSLKPPRQNKNSRTRLRND